VLLFLLDWAWWDGQEPAALPPRAAWSILYLAVLGSALGFILYLMFSAGVVLWLAYGLLIGAWPIILANGVTLVLASTVLWHKLRERRAAPAAEPIQPADM
jgi:uncharacterized membrane protein